MKHSLCLFAIVALGLAGVAGQHLRGQAPGDLGPGEKGATLRLPGQEAPAPVAAPTAPTAPPNLQGLWNTKSAAFPGVSPTPTARIAQPPSNQVDINRDIEITDKQGPWVIYAMSYSGPEAPQFAREFAIELRKNYRLNAYVFNYGAAEKLKEYERVQELKQKQIEALEKAGIKSNIMPLRVRTMKIEEQTGVLVDGGYRTREEALDALKRLRAMKLDKEFANRVKLDVKVAVKEERDKSAQNGVRVGEAEMVVINPFTRAFPARNPAMKHDHAIPTLPPEDVKLIRKLNEPESFSVLQTRKPFTLAIKQYNTQQIIVRNKKEQDGFLDRFSKGLTLKNGIKGEWTDQAAQSAHDLAEAFRKSGLAETFVLHTKYCSFVTVGAYDRVDDPALERMQEFLADRFQAQAYRPFELLPRPLPMPVPQ